MRKNSDMEPRFPDRVRYVIRDGDMETTNESQLDVLPGQGEDLVEGRPLGHDKEQLAPGGEQGEVHVS